MSYSENMIGSYQCGMKGYLVEEISTLYPTWRKNLFDNWKYLYYKIYQTQIKYKLKNKQ